MFERLDAPDNVIAIRAVGKLEKSDYETLLDPAIKDLVERTGELRAVIVVGDEFDGVTLGGAWEDTKVGFSHLTKWKRCAVVTNKDWVRHGVAMFGWMIPGAVRVFDVGQLDDAVAWAAS